MTLGFEFSVLCHLLPVHTGWESSSFVESEPAGDAGSAPKADGRTRVAVRVRRSPRWINGRCAAGAATGLEIPCRLSRLEDRHFRLPLATTQPVEGAALIRR